MIVARVDQHPSGEFHLSIRGHAPDERVCSAVTAMEQAVLLWLEQFALLNPSDLRLDVGPPPTPSTEVRPHDSFA